MWQDCEEEGKENREEPWQCAETLKTLAELNEQCLELLAEQAALPAASPQPLLGELGELYRRLDSASRRRAAACPYLLVDVGFANPSLWRWVGGHRVGDAAPTTRLTSFFTGLGATKLAQQTLGIAWHIVRTQPIGAPLYLGMPGYCVNLLRACTMRQVSELAHQHSAYLRPRWTGRVKLWRELLLAAISGNGVALERARLHGVQLLAMELKLSDAAQSGARR